jgi:hypothetical protein
VRKTIANLLSISVTAFGLWGCANDIDLVPELPSSPSGGISAVQVTGFSEQTIEFCVDLFAVDHFGGFIPGLDENCLEYTNDDGTDLTFVGLEQRTTPDKGPYSAQMIFDQSGSISSTDPDDARIDAGKAFVSVMAGSDEASISVFASGGNYPTAITRLTPFTRDKSLLDAEIENMRGRQGGGTPLYRSISQLLEVTEFEASNDNKAIVVFTDGQDTDSGISIPRLIDDARSRGVEVYTVGLGSSVEQDQLTRIALATGGSVMFAEEVAQLVSLYRSLAELLRGGADVYNVCYTLSRPPNSGSWRTGTSYRVNLRLQLPTGEIIRYPVVLFI